MPCGMIGQTTDRAVGAADRHGFYRMRRVVWENVTRRGLLDMRSNKHAPKGQKSIAQRQAKRRPGYNGPCSLRPARAKNAETERVMFTFAPTGRSVTWRFTQGVASLTLG